VDALVLISPLKKIDDIELKDSRVPKLVVFATKDNLVPVNESMEIFDFLSPPKEVLKLETDHFYSGKFDVLASSVASFLAQIQKLF
jgi:alpha/beta superfamily hydrolase